MVAAVTLLIMIPPLPSMASPWCPSKAEAREKYPHAKLYRHSSQRCWDNRRRNSRDWPLARPRTDRPVDQNNAPSRQFPEEHATTPHPELTPPYAHYNASQNPQSAPDIVLSYRGIPTPVPWIDRWTALTNDPAPYPANPRPKASPAILALISIVLLLAVIEVLFGGWIVQKIKFNKKSPGHF